MKIKETLKAVSICALLVSLVNCNPTVSFRQDEEGSAFQKDDLTSQALNPNSLTCDGIVDLTIDGIIGRKGHVEITLSGTPQSGFTGRVKLTILADATAGEEVLDSGDEGYAQIAHPTLQVLASPQVHLAISNIDGVKTAQVGFRIPLILGNSIPCL